MVTLAPASRHTLAAARSNAPPDSAKPPIGHKLRDGRQEGLECDGIGRFELPTGVGGVDDEVTESEKGGKDNGNQDRREWS